MARQLNTGDVFPEFRVQTVDARKLQIPQDFTGQYAVLIFYRGGW